MSMGAGLHRQAPKAVDPGIPALLPDRLTGEGGVSVGVVPAIGRFSMNESTSFEISRRDALKLGAEAVAGAAALAALESLPAVAATTGSPGSFNEMTVAQMQEGMASRQFQST